MQEFSVYSVIPPEGCAAILWRDASRKIEAAEALRITAKDMLALQLIDEIVKEPVGGAHQDYERAAALADEALLRHLRELEAMTSADRLETRYRKFRAMGGAGLGFVEDVVPDEARQAP
jgi:acetyl-CoA carboxylase carboxyl transferase subunit alpha